MTMRPFPWKCENCGKRAVYGDKHSLYTQSMDHDGRTYQVNVADLDVLKCRECGFVALENTALRRLSDALRETVGLLQPAEIRAHRERLGLTQRELARYLQIAEATLSRWETGAQIQQRCMDAFLRVFFGVGEARHFLGVPDHAAPFCVAQPVAQLPSFYFAPYAAFSGQFVETRRITLTATVVSNPPGSKLRLAS